MCAALFGVTSGLLYLGLTKRNDKSWFALHTLGYATAGLFFTVSTYSFFLVPVGSQLFWVMRAVSDAPMLAFAPHAVLSWRKLSSEGVLRVPHVRTAAFLMCVYATFSVYLWTINPRYWTPAWPAQYREMAAKARADQQAAEDAEKAAWGTLQGRTLSAGESAPARFNDVAVNLRPPIGWSARILNLSHPDAPGRDWFVLRWSGGAPKPMVGRVRVAQRRWETAELRSQPEPRPPGARSIRRARLFRCGPGAPRTAGLAACTPADEYLNRPPPVTAPENLFADPQGGSNFVFHTQWPLSVHGSVSVLGERFLAGCQTPTTCTAIFSYAAGAAAAEAEFPADQLHRWREIRPGVDALLRSATGRGLDDVPIVSQPEGELLALPR